MKKQLNEKQCTGNPGSMSFGKIDINEEISIDFTIEEKEVKPLPISTIKYTKDSSTKSLF